MKDERQIRAAAEALAMAASDSNLAGLLWGENAPQDSLCVLFISIGLRWAMEEDDGAVDRILAMISEKNAQLLERLQQRYANISGTASTN